MGYTNVALKDKIMEMYPEITQHNISVSLDFDEEKNVYAVDGNSFFSKPSIVCCKSGCIFCKSIHWKTR